MGYIYPVESKASLSLEIFPRLRLAKLPLCMLVAFSTAFGYLVALPVYSGQLVLTTLGVLFLATGGATWNSIQEVHFDARMERTKDRPLVRKEVSVTQAGIQACFLLLVGVILLVFSSDSLYPAVVGFSAIIIYNLIYTQLKEKTTFAIVPGAVCGALPPYIGWLAGGGDYFSYQAFMLFNLLVLWQVPHFFLVLLNHKKDYADSTFPNMLSLLREMSLRRILIPWIGALSTMMLIFTVMLNGISFLGQILICGNAIVLFTLFVMHLLVLQRPNYRFLFLHLNFSIFFIMFVICAEVV